MALSLSGAGEISNTGATPVTGVPLTMACWFNSNVATAAPISVRDSTGNERFQLVTGAVGHVLQAQSIHGGTAVTAQSTGIWDQGVWTHGCAVFDSSTSRACYINGGNKGTNTTSSTPTSINRIRLAVSYNGAIAEVAIWNIALTDADVASLATGFSPLLIRPESLAFYAPLIGRYSPEIDLVGGINLTLTSTSVADHVRVFYPKRPRNNSFAGAAVVGGSGLPFFFQKPMGERLGML